MESCDDVAVKTGKIRCDARAESDLLRPLARAFFEPVQAEP